MGYNTKQGELILNLLKSSGGRHLTAEDISHILGERGCPVGKATVYRHLEKMLREGSVRKFVLHDGESACYQYVGDSADCCNHYHLKCSECGKLSMSSAAFSTRSRSISSSTTGSPSARRIPCSTESAPSAPKGKRMKTKLLRAAAVILCAAMIFSLAACSSGKIESKSDKLRVVCTLFVPYDFVREIAGDRVDLTLLLPPGMESHSYDPTPADMKAVSNADLLIRVGENMETWSAKLFDKSTGAGEYLDIASEMGLRLAAHEHEHEHGHEDEHEHEHEYEEGFVDAHIWTDPVYAQGMVKVITDALCRLDGRNAEFYKSNSEKYISKLQSLDAGFKDAVKNGKRDIIVFSGRFAFRNFTERYSLKFVSALDACADNSEPGARTVAKIINTVKNGNIPVIFYEELAEPRTAEIICGETGCSMRLFHSCHNVSRDEFESGVGYLSLMNDNLRNLREALS